MLSKCCTIIANILSNYCQYIAQDLASLTIDSICSIFIGILKGAGALLGEGIGLAARGGGTSPALTGMIELGRASKVG